MSKIRLHVFEDLAINLADLAIGRELSSKFEIKKVSSLDFLSGIGSSDDSSDSEYSDGLLVAGSLVTLELIRKYDVAALISLQDVDPKATIAAKNQGDCHPLAHYGVVFSLNNYSAVRVAFWQFDVRRSYGKVWLVGFGPGDLELMTVKSQRLIEEADSIFYDDLIDAVVLKGCVGFCQYVGKRKGNHSQHQNEINQLLANAALRGKTVVRLKGGDPLIFGRGGEEADYLTERLIPFEIVPGVSAANGAAASLGIPLTHRDLSRVASFHTAHGRKPAEEIPGKGETQVYYMAASRLAETADELIEKGWPIETKAALVRSATLFEEECVITELRDLAKISISSPLLLIVGDTVANAKKQRKLIFAGNNPYRLNLPEQLVKFSFLNLQADLKGELDLSRFDGIVFESLPELISACELFQRFPSHFLFYVTSNELQVKAIELGLPSDKILDISSLKAVLLSA